MSEQLVCTRDLLCKHIIVVRLEEIRHGPLDGVRPPTLLFDIDGDVRLFRGRLEAVSVKPVQMLPLLRACRAEGL